MKGNKSNKTQMMTLTNPAFWKKSNGLKSFLLLSWSVEFGFNCDWWLLGLCNRWWKTQLWVFVIDDKKHNLGKSTSKPVCKSRMGSGHQQTGWSLLSASWKPGTVSKCRTKPAIQPGTQVAGLNPRIECAVGLYLQLNKHFALARSKSWHSDVRPAQDPLFMPLFKLHVSYESCTDFVAIPCFILFQAGGIIASKKQQEGLIKFLALSKQKVTFQL